MKDKLLKSDLTREGLLELIKDYKQNSVKAETNIPNNLKLISRTSVYKGKYINVYEDTINNTIVYIMYDEYNSAPTAVSTIKK